MKKGLLSILAGALFLGNTACSMPYIKRDEVVKDFLRKEDVAASYIKKEDLGKYVAEAFKERFPDSVDGKYDSSGIFVDWNKYNINELIDSKETIEMEVVYKIDTTDNPEVLVSMTLFDFGSGNGIIKGRLDRIIRNIESNPEFKSEFKGNEPYKEGNNYFYKAKFKGSATGIFDKYILTPEHVINGGIENLPLPIIDEEGNVLVFPTGQIALMKVPLEEVSRKYSLVVGGERKELTRVISDKNVDAALLKTKDYNLKKSINNLPYKFGNSDELGVGNWAMLVGKPLNMDNNTRFGTITNVNPVETSKVPTRNTKNNRTHNAAYLFSVSASVILGDSGSLVLAARDGKLEIVGFIEAVFPQADMNMATRSNNYLDVILPALVKDNSELAKTKEFQEFFGNYLNSKVGSDKK